MVLHQVLGAVQVLIAALIILSYSFVWITISNSARRLKHFLSEKSKSYSTSNDTLSTTQGDISTISHSDMSVNKMPDSKLEHLVSCSIPSLTR